VNDQPFLSTPARNSESTLWYSTASPFVDSALKIEPHHPVGQSTQHYGDQDLGEHHNSHQQYLSNHRSKQLKMNIHL
jgi:hypothetical protein